MAKGDDILEEARELFEQCEEREADIAYDTAVDFAVSCGFGYFRINTAYVEDDTFEQDIRIARFANPFSVYGDPFSDAPDSSDWNVAFVLDRMKRSVFEKRYAGADLSSWADPRWDMVGEPWKQDSDTVGVAEYWTREQVKKPIVALSNATIVAVKEYEKNKALFDARGVSVVGSPRDVSASPIAAGMLRDTDLSAYMNPYTQSVIDTSLADLSRARDVQRVADNQAATRANAFGGSRQGVADSLTNEAYLRNVASTSANLRNAGYDRAASAAIADLDRALGANQFNSGQAYDAQKTNTANRLAADQFNAGMAFDVGRTNAANDLAEANFRLNAAGGLAGLSNQELSMALARAGALGAVGDAQQQNQQARADADYEEFMRMIGYPAQQQQLRNQALGMMPVQQTNTTTTKNNPGFLDYVNSAANLIGAVYKK